jgi:hypothetical protein
MTFNNPIRRFFMPESNGAASPEDVQNQQKLNDTLDGTLDTVRQIQNEYRGIGAQLETLLNNRIRNLNIEEETKKVYKGISQDIVGGLRRQQQESNQINKILEKQTNGSLKVADVNSLLEKSKSRQKSIEDSLNEAIAEGLINQEEANEQLEKTRDIYNKIKNELGQSLIKAEKFEKTLGITYKIFDGISKIPILNSLVKIEKIKEKMEETAATGAGAFSVFGKGIQAAFGQIGKSLKDPLILLTAQIAILKKFFDAYGVINQRIVDQGKQLNISKEQSQALYESAAKYSAEQRNAFVSTSRILEGRAKLNEALGTSIIFSEKEAITAEKLTHYYGLNEEQSAHLAVLARETNQTNDDILNNVIRTTNEQKRQFGGTMSQQKAMQKISSVSGEILTKFKGNVGELTKAVLQADRLGLTLEQVDKIGESLLNFEQSIEAELKAELLLGKSINLEKARAAALSGDQSKLMNEIATQVGNIHQFEKLNVIQRKAYAEVFNMTAGEMGDMLRKREFEAKLGADAQKSAEEQLKIAKERGITIDESVRKDLEAKSLAELQKYTFEKIRDILAKITSGPMKVLYNYLEKGLKFVEKIFGFFGKMTGGGLGDALGAVLLGLPLAVGLVRSMMGLFALGIKGLLIPKPTGRPMDPVYTMQSMGPGGGGIGAGGPRTGFVPGVGYVGSNTKTFTPTGNAYVQGGVAYSANTGKQLYGNASTQTLLAAQNAQAARAATMMKVGGGLMIGGMAANMVAANMDEGAAKDTVGVLGQTASFAGMGAMFGPWGAAIGGLVGLGVGLFSLAKENEERRKKEEEKAKAVQENTNAILKDLAMRPLQLNINNEGINKFNTYTSMASANGVLGQ